MAIYEYHTLHPKLLLAGEYSVLIGGDAFTIPFKDYSVRFGFLDDTLDYEQARDSNRQLLEFYQYLKKQQKIAGIIDCSHFESDLHDGLYLLSTVPSGYGLGSSGLVCASIYKTYAREKTIPGDHAIDFETLRTNFSCMEAYFHGKSSGIDPLASFVGKPLYISGNRIQMVPSPVMHEGRWFILDAGVQRKTAHLVHTFLVNFSNPVYRQELELQYLPVVNELVQCIRLSGSIVPNDWTTTKPMHSLLEAISKLQLHFFRQMICDDLIPLWQHGLDTGLFSLKLLGAGGGGYFLGFTNNTDATQQIALGYGFTISFVDI
jgi:mevalonate kinase